mmetsp:Transcript_48732/g.153196  ORF Transcript_48732/g.153196 Transcript_48732/m.153196 type:complete len:283 (-) Transcript_48732:71-919(-)
MAPRSAGAVLLLCAAGCVTQSRALRRPPLSYSTVMATSESVMMHASGSFAGISYSAWQKNNSEVFIIQFDLPGMKLDVEADCSDYSVLIDSHGNAVDADVVARFQQLDENVESLELPMETCSAERLLRGSIALMARAPLGAPLEPRRPRASPKTAGASPATLWRSAEGRLEGASPMLPGIRCLRVMQPATAVWSDSGGLNEEFLVVGMKEGRGYGCMGRCGRGCSLSFLSFFTQDCLNHDMCSYMNLSTKGRLDKNCGDEFARASDDYIFAASQCRQHKKEM